MIAMCNAWSQASDVRSKQYLPNFNVQNHALSQAKYHQHLRTKHVRRQTVDRRENVESHHKQRS